MGFMSCPPLTNGETLLNPTVGLEPRFYLQNTHSMGHGAWGWGRGAVYNATKCNKYTIQCQERQWYNIMSDITGDNSIETS